MYDLDSLGLACKFWVLLDEITPNGTFMNQGNIKFIRIFILFFFFLPLLSCYNYLSDDIPIISKPVMDKRFPFLSIQVQSAEGEAERQRISDLYVKYLEETGHFGRVLGNGVRAPLHFEIFTSVMDEYENAWYSFTSSLFSIGTLGLLPAFYGERRIMRVKIFKDNLFLTEKIYTQKHVTLYSIIFVFIWELGIEESKIIEYNKEKNLIHNLVQDLNEL